MKPWYLRRTLTKTEHERMAPHEQLARLRHRLNNGSLQRAAERARAQDTGPRVTHARVHLIHDLISGEAVAVDGQNRQIVFANGIKLSYWMAQLNEENEVLYYDVDLNLIAKSAAST